MLAQKHSWSASVCGDVTTQESLPSLCWWLLSSAITVKVAWGGGTHLQRNQSRSDICKEDSHQAHQKCLASQVRLGNLLIGKILNNFGSCCCCCGRAWRFITIAPTKFKRLVGGRRRRKNLDMAILQSLHRWAPPPNTGCWHTYTKAFDKPVCHREWMISQKPCGKDDGLCEAITAILTLLLRGEGDDKSNLAKRLLLHVFVFLQDFLQCQRHEQQRARSE